MKRVYVGESARRKLGHEQVGPPSPCFLQVLIPVELVDTHAPCSAGLIAANRQESWNREHKRRGLLSFGRGCTSPGLCHGRVRAAPYRVNKSGYATNCWTSVQRKSGRRLLAEVWELVQLSLLRRGGESKFSIVSIQSSVKTRGA